MIRNSLINNNFWYLAETTRRSIHEDLGQLFSKNKKISDLNKYQVKQILFNRENPNNTNSKKKKKQGQTDIFFTLFIQVLFKIIF